QTILRAGRADMKTAFFVAKNSSGKIGLWATDGTTVGTREINAPGASTGSLGLDPAYLTAIADKVLFSGVDAQGVRSLWVTDAATTGTSEIDLASLFGVSNLVTFGHKVLFDAGPATSGYRGLWITDGTKAGTHEITVSGASADGLRFSAF